MKVKALFGITLLGLAAPSFASNWSGSAELGFSNSSGNSEDRTLNAKMDMDYANDSWRRTVFGDVYNSESSGDQTAERYVLGYKPSYFINKRDYVFGLVRYDKDKFSDIDDRYTEVLGVGRQFINTDKTYLEGEVGLGARQTNYINPLTTADDSEAIYYVGGRFTHTISDSVRFLQILRVEDGSSNTYTESVSGLQFKVTDAVSAKVTHTVRYNTDITGVLGKRTDQITGVNFVYSF
jgi:putative salt-induced outer membrane protein